GDEDAYYSRSDAWSNRDRNPRLHRETRSAAAAAAMHVRPTRPTATKPLANAKPPLANAKPPLANANYASYEQKRKIYEVHVGKLRLCETSAKRKASREILMRFRMLRCEIMDISAVAYRQHEPATKVFAHGLAKITKLLRTGAYTDEGEWLMHEQLFDIAEKIYIDATCPQNGNSLSKPMVALYAEIARTAKQLCTEATRENEHVG
ncbi:hypothetical protein T484DRAFT_3634880, partial [Baffinella frigidus]